MVNGIRVLLGLSVFWIGAVLHAEEKQPSKIVYFTTPKGGSQLFKKVIGLVTERPLRMLSALHEDLLNPNNPCISYHHLEPGYESILDDETGTFTKVIMIRDPRDVIVSMAAWIEVMADTDRARTFVRLPLDDQISLLITDPDLSMNGRYEYVFDTHSVVQTALKWMTNSKVLVCRFEDLVGPEGGGSRIRQLATIDTLAQHLHYDLSKEQISQIADDLFGDTATFRKGQIGSWRQVFTPDHKELFKAKMGRELIELGYEQDDTW